MKATFTAALFFICLSPLPVLGQFDLLGDAISTGGDCYRLTKVAPYELGAAYYTDKIDLNKSFELGFIFNFGCSEFGADGMACIFQNEAPLALGADGGYMGFSGTGTDPLNPSVAIEFDTYQNSGFGFNDPIEDHIGIMKNGNIDHAFNLAGPVNIDASGTNAEDCADRNILITWDHNSYTLSVFVDCDLRLSYTGDIINDIFSGESLVYLGFSAATGGASNIQKFCFDYLRYNKTASDTSLCQGDTITLDFESDFSTFSWSPAISIDDITAMEPNVWPSADINYIVSVTGDCGNTYIDTIFADVFTGLYGTEDINICDGESYVLPDGSSVSTSGVYVYHFTTFAGCDSSVITTLTVHPVYAYSEDVNICEGDSYILPDGSSVSAAGTYTSNLLTAAGCDSVITTDLTLTPLSYASVDADICSGEFYFFADGSSTITAGTYETIIPAASGCDSTITTTLAVHPVYSIPESVDICTGSTYTLPDGSIAPGAGVYYSNFSTVSGCDSIIVTTVNELDVIYTTVDADICQGDTYTLPDGVIVTTAGTYTASYFTISGCDSVITTNLVVNANPEISFTPDDIICIENGNYMLVASPAGGTYDGDHVEAGAFSATGAGVGGPYAVTYYYTDVNGCSDTATAFISVEANYAEAFGDTTIVAGTAAAIFGVTDGDYLWSPAFFIDCASCATAIVTPQQTTTYTLGSTDENGCYASDAVTITVVPDPGEYIFIPNSFSPNGDQVNDYFFAYGPNLVLIKDMRIYDRWGEVVFEREDIPATDVSLGWNGSQHGLQLNAGVFAYTILLQFADGGQQLTQGNITLVK